MYLKKLNLAILLLFASITGFCSTKINEIKTYYQITGNNAQELRDQMNLSGPLYNHHRYDATTIWNINWRYTWHFDSPSQNPCYVTNVDVVGDIITTLPLWSNQQSGSQELQEKWRKYLTHLNFHEDGHKTNGKKAAREIEAALSNMAPAANCQALQTALDNKAKEIIQQHKEWDLQYDRDTNHGKTQGAVFP